MNIRLNSLHLKHFKGIKDFTLKIDGKNASVYADNGVGKTTLADSFLWLLFGKDSTDRTAFKIKPQDANGNDIHHLQTEVEAELSIDGKLLKLRKMLEEKWTKKRGSAEAELTGNTISYWWDDVPVKESEFKLRISELINEGIFRMITNPMYFNTRLSWQDRRKILLEMCGDLSDEQVIASDEKLSRLTEILQGKTIEEYKKILNERIKRLEKERADIPPRIDELTLSLPQGNTDYSAAEAELRQYKDELEGIELGLTDASKAAAEFSKKQQELYKLKNNLIDIKARIDADVGADRKKLIDEKAALTSHKYLLESNINTLTAEIQRNQALINKNRELRERLLSEWKLLTSERAIVFAEEFTEPTEDNFVCPMCGQKLPEDAKEDKLNELRASFQVNKDARILEIDENLKHNKANGLSVKYAIELAEANIKQHQEKIATLQTQLNETITRLNEIEAEIEKPVAKPDYNSNPEYAALQQQIEALEVELSQPIEDKTSALLQRKREVQVKIDECNRILNSRTVAENTRKRIEELKAEERQLAQQITELEGHKYLIEQFTVAKVNLLEDKINSRFKYVKFKLFETQLNGGIAETCQALVNTNGVYVPFDDANHAGKINAGLDIINSLCSHYDVTAPIFIDFRESVSRIIETNSQIINLIKSEPDKVLRVVLEK